MTVKEHFDRMDYGPAPESPAPALAWLDGHDRRFGPVIGGAVHTDGAEVFETCNPATAAPLAQIAQACADQIDAAVAAARAAQPDWHARGGAARARVLYALARVIQRHARLFAVLETLDTGKPIREARDIDIPLVARHFYYHAGLAQLIDTARPGHAPHGVCAQVIPWNFPLLMLAWKVAPALAAGNTVVLKPAEQTPLTALLFAELAQTAGLPDGVLNLVTGDGRIGAALVAHRDIDKVAFTGSTEVGREIRRATAGQGKALTLELGGKSPFIVCADADLDSAVEGLVDAIWFNQGEVCCAGSRLIVQEGIADAFLAKLRARMAHLRVGDPLDKCTDIGAMISPAQGARVREMIATAPAGSVFSPAGPLPETGGVFLPPTLITDLEPAHPLMQDEIFGPVLVSTTFRTASEAVALANNTAYGLAATVWSETLGLALELAGQIRAGVVWVNASNLFDAAAGFGGVRESGFGREGGWEGLDAYLRPARFPEATPSQAPNSRAPARPARLDRTLKHYIGGRQVRPDSGYSQTLRAPDGSALAEIPEGSRKDIRNAVEAAGKAVPGWSAATAHLRAQVLFYIAENLEARAAALCEAFAATGMETGAATREIAAASAALFTFAAWADKHDGAVKPVPLRAQVLALNEPVGVVGALLPPAHPLLGPATVLAAALGLGNTAVIVPDPAHPFAAAELVQVLETSDVPAGVANIVFGAAESLGPVLARHAGVDTLWSFRGEDCAAEIERATADTLKRSWITEPGLLSAASADARAQQAFLGAACTRKTVWLPYGDAG